MANIWKQNQSINENPNRNHFDLTYQNHLTLKMGGLYPIMCKEVVPGDTFKIDTAFGLKFMPLVFPVQSRMRAHVHYFYVRNKNIWKNWQNFIQDLEPHEHPYIVQPASFFKTGSLADYLDVPTTVVSQSTMVKLLQSQSTGWVQDDARPVHTRVEDGRVSVTHDDVNVENCGLFPYSYRVNDLTVGKRWSETIDQTYGASTAEETLLAYYAWLVATMYYYDVPIPAPVDGTRKFVFETLNATEDFSLNPRECILVAWSQPKNIAGEHYTQPNFPNGGLASFAKNRKIIALCNGSLNNEYVLNQWTFTAQSDTDYTSFIGHIDKAIEQNETVTIGLCFQLPFTVDGQDTTVPDADVTLPLAHMLPNKQQHLIFTGRYQVTVINQSVEDAPDSPFDNSLLAVKKGVRLSALPFRAYESVYNAYYRDYRTQPFIVDGQEVFNRYVTTDDDGGDTTNYKLQYRNYELDYLTSSLPSPQFGAAPLVGMSALGNITVQDENGVTTAVAELDNDGNITNVAVTSPVASIEHGRTLMNIAASGFTINDFRNVNALQRFLETTLRKGYKYRDFIAGHFGKEPSYQELDMPEFIGGTSQDVQVNAVTNMTSADNSSALGAFAGTANAFGASRNTVTKYCDDYGFIIGIMCVVPSPAYSQMLPKHYTHAKQLDYYFPEFAQLGMQPITYQEVTPINAYYKALADNDFSLTNTFAYQRPNYDLVGYTDQVHGEFRTTLRNFLINRVFSDVPELGNDFVIINPEEVNDIFAYTDPAADTIIGQVVIKIDAQRPVPRITIPSLGR